MLQLVFDGVFLFENMRSRWTSRSHLLNSESTTCCTAQNCLSNVSCEFSSRADCSCIGTTKRGEELLATCSDHRQLSDERTFEVTFVLADEPDRERLAGLFVTVE